MICKRALSLSIALLILSPLALGQKADRPSLTLIGIDAGDFVIINTLRKRGLLPTFNRYINEGASGYLESIHPTFSPTVWTTIATGLTPMLHGIKGFKVYNPKTKNQVPVNATLRRSEAIWNILTEKGFRSLITGWFVTWPAEKINGYFFSDYTFPLANTDKTADFLEDKTNMDLKDQTYPRNLYHKVKKLFIDKNAENPQFEKRFGIKVSQAPYALKHSYAKDLSYYRIFKQVRARKRFDFHALYLQGPDLLGHKFMKEFMGVIEGRLNKSSKEYQQGRLIIQYYMFIDQLLSYYDRKIRRPNEVIMIVSDHGFEDKGKHVLTKVSDFHFKKKRYWHRKHGVIIAHGPKVAKGSTIANATVFDVVPTILTYFGLPAAENMSGQSIKDIVPRNERDRVASYEKSKKRHSAKLIRESPYDQSILESLNDLGYIQ